MGTWIDRRGNGRVRAALRNNPVRDLRTRTRRKHACVGQRTEAASDGSINRADEQNRTRQSAHESQFTGPKKPLSFRALSDNESIAIEQRSNQHLFRGVSAKVTSLETEFSCAVPGLFPRRATA